MDRRKLDKQNLDNSSLDMSKRSISDFKPIINVILSNPSTRRVDLSDNCITQLPKDLSMLKEVYEINLIDNELSPFESAVVALSTVPSLTHLHLNLHEEQQVDFVIKTLPNLLVLNGEDIDREELQNESESEHRFEAEQQDTNNNEIKQIKELEEEDELSENHIKNIANDKRNSEIINSSCTGSDILNYSDSEEISLKPQDLETVALIFDKIRNMHRKNKLSNDKEMANEFDKHLKTWMQKLSDIVTAENTTINVKNSAILRTKFDLGEICHEKAMQYLNKKDKNIGKVYSKTYQIHSEIITDYDRLYTALANRYEEKKLQNSSLSKEIEQLKAELNNAKIERAAVLDIGENIEKQMQAKQIDYEKSLQR